MAKTLKSSADGKKKDNTAGKGSDSITKQKKEDGISFFDPIFSEASIGIFLLDKKRNIIRANRFFQTLVKYSEAELMKMKAKDITHPDDWETDEKLFDEVTAGKRNDYVIVKRYITKNGETIHARLTISHTHKYNSKKAILLGFVEDISPQISCETSLASEKNYLKVLLENIPDSIYFKDLQSRFLKVSDSLAKKHHIKTEDLIGKTDFDFFGKIHAAQAFEDEQAIIRTGIPIMEKEEKEDWPDGSATWVSTVKMPFRDENGNMIGTFGISRSITNRKKNELIHEALFKISEAVFTASDMKSMFVTIHYVLTTLMPVKNIFIALYDEDKDILTFPYYIDEYDEPRESTKPKNGLTEYILRTGKAQLIDEDMDYELRAKGEVNLIGTPAKIWMGIPLRIEDKTIGVIVLQDYENPKAFQELEMQLVSFIAEQIALVIARKRHSFEIMQYTEELKQLNATKDKFFSIIAHDLKNPFITILGFSEMLLSDFEELTDEEKLYYLQEMKKTSERSHTLLQNLLLWSRSQTGYLEFHPEPLSLDIIVEQNIDLLKSTAEKKGIKLISEIDADIKILADSDMINTVVRNLISNAIKFTPRGGIITISSFDSDGKVNVSVSDTGVGMDKETTEKIFRIDVSHTTQGTENETGSGLGLVLCREFIKKNGGDIWVESTLNSGSKFTFSVPAAGE